MSEPGNAIAWTLVRRALWNIGFQYQKRITVYQGVYLLLVVVMIVALFLEIAGLAIFTESVGLLTFMVYIAWCMIYFLVPVALNILEGVRVMQNSMEQRECLQTECVNLLALCDAVLCAC
jgi:hypothetical protein